ncbi:MAG: hypothetical protein GXY74_14845 [Phycisphaerae bacterium]|nr:hypothetical protein [Phycisphaerae bacterium]
MIGRWAGCAAAVALALAMAGPAQATVYTADNAPAAPTLEELPLKESVTQYGITWTFETPARVGQFVNGDYYVVGPVTVTAIDPKPRVGAEVGEDELDANEKGLREKVADRVRNGSMLNPSATQKVGWDSGVKNWFRRNVVTVPPVSMKPGDSLVSTISLKLDEGAVTPYVGHRNMPPLKRAKGDNSPVKTAAVLTCMAEPQPADAFRPGYCDTTNRVYLARHLKRQMLRTLPKPENAPKLETWVRVFQRPWVNLGFFGFDQPMENMPHYGQWVGQAQSMGGLMLMLDFTAEEKEPLLVNMVQVGIDYWSAVKNGHPGWEGWGGHGSGRKFPIVLAGVLLGDEQMASPTAQFPKVNFGEDNQTMYGDCWTGAKVCFAGHSGKHQNDIPRPQWGPYEHMQPKDWQNKGDRKNYQSEAYRRANSSSSWPGQALAIRLLGAEKQWNHDAFFDYVDRWMYENDKEFCQEINKYFPDKSLVDEGATWFHQGQAWEPFVTGMYLKHRPTLAAPTDGWKTGKP